MSRRWEPLLGQIKAEIGQFTGDGAYDGTPTYNAVLRHSVQAGTLSRQTNGTVMSHQSRPMVG